MITLDVAGAVALIVVVVVVPKISWFVVAESVSEENVGVAPVLMF